MGRHIKLFLIVSVVLGLTLIACGGASRGGGPDPSPPPSDAPPPDDDSDPPPAPPSGEAGEAVVLVVRNEDALTSREMRLRDHLRAGFAREVRLVAQDGSVALDDVGLIVISPSTSAELVADRYRDVAVPALVLNHEVWDAMDLAEGSSATGSETELTVIDAASPLAHGLWQGAQRAFSAARTLGHLVGPAPGVVPVAAAGDQGDEIVLFTLERGAALTAGTAPERRVGFGAGDDAYDDLLAPAWDVIDAAVTWLAGEDTRSERRALIVAGHDLGEFNLSEIALRSRLKALGFEVTVVRDESLTDGQANGFDVAVMSKTVRSTAVGTKLKGTVTGVLFWEDNQQMTSMMATIDNDGSSGTSWHSTREHVYVDAEAPAALAAGYEGAVRLYTAPGEVTWAPAGQLSEDAMPIARLGDDGSEGRYAIYAYEAGASLADGTPAAARRVYLGLYDDTFRHLTLDGVALFDAALRWAADQTR